MKKVLVFVLVALLCIVSLSVGMGEGAPGKAFSLLDYWYENGDLSAGTLFFDVNNSRYASVAAGQSVSTSGTFVVNDGDKTVELTDDEGNAFMTLELTNRARITDKATGVVYVRSTAVTGQVVNEEVGHDTELTVDGNTTKFKDYDLQIVATYPNAMKAMESAIKDAVVVTDNNSGYVTGRNITELYAAKAGSDDEFAAEYISQNLAADFKALYGTDPEAFEPVFVSSMESNRIATGEIEMVSGDTKVQVFVIIFTCTFSDGDEMVIAKTLFANLDDETQMDSLWDSVVVSAVRRTS